MVLSHMISVSQSGNVCALAKDTAIQIVTTSDFLPRPSVERLVLQRSSNRLEQAKCVLGCSLGFTCTVIMEFMNFLCLIMSKLLINW